MNGTRLGATYLLWLKNGLAKLLSCSHVDIQNSDIYKYPRQASTA